MKSVFVAYVDERRAAPDPAPRVVYVQRTVDRTSRSHRKETRRERESFEQVRNAERHYGAQLRKVAAQVGRLADTTAGDPDDPATVARLTAILRRYAQDIRPWARTAAAAMLADVNRRDERAWLRLSNLMGSELEHEIRNAPTGAKMLQLLEEQVDLITSIPLDAAQRVHKLATQNLVSGTRADQIARAIQSSAHVSRGRANLIARTEVGRASGALTQARAEYVGSPGYFWMSLGDVDVRPEHKKLNGTFHRWDKPPYAGSGMHYHAGMGPNCRCFPQPVIN